MIKDRRTEGLRMGTVPAVTQGHVSEACSRGANREQVKVALQCTGLLYAVLMSYHDCTWQCLDCRSSVAELCRQCLLSNLTVLVAHVSMQFCC